MTDGLTAVAPFKKAPLTLRYIDSLRSLPTGFPKGFRPSKDVEMLKQTKQSTASQRKAGHHSSGLDGVPPTAHPIPAGMIDLASSAEGALVLASSSAHYSRPENLLKPARGINMGDGWETARMRPAVQSEVFDLKGPVREQFNWTLVALHQDVRLVLAPVELRIEKAGPTTGRGVLRVALIDARLSNVYWSGEIPSDTASAFSS